MQLFSLFLCLAVGCQEQEKTTKPEVLDKPTLVKKNLKPKAIPTKLPAVVKRKFDAATVVKNIVTSILKKDTLDINITKSEVQKDGSNKIHIEGDAADNATVSVLLKALEGNEQLQKVYLEKSDDNQQKDNPRKIFSITALYAPK